MMKFLFITALIFISAFYTLPAGAQNIVITPNCAQPDTTQLKAKKKKIRAAEKEKLKKEVIKIEQALREGDITKTKAEQKKRKAAEKHARNIDNQIVIINAKLALIRRNGQNTDYSGTPCTESKIELTSKNHHHRTHSHIVLAFGFDNAIGRGQPLDDSPYKIGGSRFFEIGYEFSTALIENGFLRLNYGLSFQFNGLKPIGSHIFAKQGNQVLVEDVPYKVEKAKLRQDNLVLPVYLEIGPTDAAYHAKKFKLGLGGYVGLNLRTIQKLKYTQNGDHEKKKESFSSKTNNFIYGLGGYIGYHHWALYVKYDLNAIFRDNPEEEHNVTAGIRFTF